MQKLLTVAADRLAGVDDAGAHWTRHLGTRGVLNTTVWAEDDVLTSVHTHAAERTSREFRGHVVTSSDSQ